MIISIAAAIVVLGLLILFHELGHFFVAKRAGVGVLMFSIGFGPKLLGRRLGGTEYALSAIPLGGFVKMVGEDPEEEVSEADRKIPADVPDDEAIIKKRIGIAKTDGVPNNY